VLVNTTLPETRRPDFVMEISPLTFSLNARAKRVISSFSTHSTTKSGFFLVSFHVRVQVHKVTRG